MSLRTLEKIRSENLHFQELHVKMAQAFVVHLEKILKRYDTSKIQLI